MFSVYRFLYGIASHWSEPCAGQARQSAPRSVKAAAWRSSSHLRPAVHLNEWTPTGQNSIGADLGDRNATMFEHQARLYR